MNYFHFHLLKVPSFVPKVLGSNIFWWLSQDNAWKAGRSSSQIVRERQREFGEFYWLCGIEPLHHQIYFSCGDSTRNSFLPSSRNGEKWYLSRLEFSSWIFFFWRSCGFFWFMLHLPRVLRVDWLSILLAYSRMDYLCSLLLLFYALG